MLHEALSLRASIGKKLRMWEAKKYRYYQFGCERSEQDLERNSEASGICSSFMSSRHGKHLILDLRLKKLHNLAVQDSIICSSIAGLLRGLRYGLRMID